MAVSHEFTLLHDSSNALLVEHNLPSTTVRSRETFHHCSQGTYANSLKNDAKRIRLLWVENNYGQNLKHSHIALAWGVLSPYVYMSYGGSE